MASAPYGSVSLLCTQAALQRPRIPTLLSAFLTLLNDRLSESIFLPLLPFLLEDFSSNGSTVGLLSGTYALSQFAVAPLIGALSDRFGRKPVISLCVFGSVIGMGLFAMTVSLASMAPKRHRTATRHVVHWRE